MSVPVVPCGKCGYIPPRAGFTLCGKCEEMQFVPVAGLPFVSVVGLPFGAPAQFVPVFQPDFAPHPVPPPLVVPVARAPARKSAPEDHAMVAVKTVGVPIAAVTCPRGDACENTDCEFDHTRKVVSPGAVPSKPRKCKFGSKCRKASCRFVHDEKEPPPTPSAVPASVAASADSKVSSQEDILLAQWERVKQMNMEALMRIEKAKQVELEQRASSITPVRSPAAFSEEVRKESEESEQKKKMETEKMQAEKKVAACKFGSKCRRANCKFAHPPAAVVEKEDTVRSVAQKTRDDVVVETRKSESKGRRGERKKKNGGGKQKVAQGEMRNNPEEKRRRDEEEEKKRRDESEKKRQEAEQEEEQKRRQQAEEEEQRSRDAEEEKKREGQKRREVEEEKKREEQKRRRAEQEVKKRREEEEKRKKAEEEKRRQLEEEQKRLVVEERKRIEEERARAGEARLRAEETKRNLEEEKKKKAEDELKRQAEDERRKQLQAKKREIEEEHLREKKRLEGEARAREAELEKWRIREAARKAEEEAQRRQEEAAEQRRRQLQAEEAKARKAAVEEEQRRAAKEAKVQERERRLAQARERLAEKEKEEKKRLLREKTKLVPVLQKCTASISSLAVLLDYEVVLSIVARNCDDEVIKAVDRSAFVVLLRAPPSSETVFKPARVLPSGAMEFVLKMSSLGTRVVAAYLNNVLIKSFEVQVTQRPAAAEYCKVSGVLAGQVGSVTWLTVKAYDDRGKFLGAGKHEFSVQVDVKDERAKLLRPSNVTVRDNEDGTFSVSFEPRIHGPHIVQVFLHSMNQAGAKISQHVQGSPFALQVARRVGSDPTIAVTTLKSAVAVVPGQKVPLVPTGQKIVIRVALEGRVKGKAADLVVAHAVFEGCKEEGTVVEAEDGAFVIEFSAKANATLMTVTAELKHEYLGLECLAGFPMELRVSEEKEFQRVCEELDKRKRAEGEARRAEEELRRVAERKRMLDEEAWKELEQERQRQEEEAKARTDMQLFRKNASKPALVYLDAVEGLKERASVATHLKIIERDCVKKLTPYEWLLVSRDVSEDALKVAFKKVCLVLHPDKVEVELRSLAQSCFVEMKKSYDLIRTPELRKNYDRFTMGPFHQHYNDYDPYEDEEDGEEMFYDMDQAAFMFFARFGGFPPGFAQGGFPPGFAQSFGGFGGYNDDCDCGSAAARDCTNGACKRCCGQYGRNSCSRHKVTKR